MPRVLGVKDGNDTADSKLKEQDKTFWRVKTFKRTYFVLADTTADDEETIIATTGIPQLFSTYNGMSVKGHSLKESSTVIHPITGVATILWEVTVNWDSDFDPDAESEQEDPTLRTPTIRWSGETEEEVLEEDAITGDPIQTDAEEAIITTTSVVLPVLEIRRYETYPFDPDIILDYANRVNSSAFWGAAAGSALMLPMEADEETIDSVKYAVVTYRIKFRIKPGISEPWKARLLHQGTKYRHDVGATPKVYTDENGNPATINLAAGGTPLASGSPPHYLEFNRYTTVDFNALNLGPF